MGLLALAGCQLVSGLSDYEATESGVGGSGASSSSAGGAGGSGGTPIPENQWARSFGSQDADIGMAVALGPEGQVFCGGGFQGADFDGRSFLGYGLDDAYVMELDRDGAVVWATAMGGAGSDRVFDVAVEESTGRFAVVGLFEQELIFSDEGTPNLIGSPFGASVFVVVFDANRNIAWTRVIEGNASVRAPANLMGSGIHRIAFTPDGGVVLTGRLSGSMSLVPDGPTLTGEQEDADFWVFALDSVGGYKWHRAVRSSSSTFVDAEDDGPPGLGVDDQGRVFVGGTVSGTLTVEGELPLVVDDLDAYVLRFGPDGASQVRENIGGSGVQILTALSVQSDGTALMGGADVVNDPELRADIFLRRLNADGAELDSIAFAGTPNPMLASVEFSTLSTVDVDDNGDVVAAGAVYRRLVVGDTTLQTNDHYDMFVVRLDDQLDPITVQQFGGPDDDIVLDAALDAAGRIVLTGGYLERLNMLGSALESAGSLDILVAKLFVDD